MLVALTPGSISAVRIPSALKVVPAVAKGAMPVSRPSLTSEFCARRLYWPTWFTNSRRLVSVSSTSPCSTIFL